MFFQRDSLTLLLLSSNILIELYILMDLEWQLKFHNCSAERGREREREEESREHHSQFKWAIHSFWD